MACGGCAKRRAQRSATRKSKEEQDLMGGYANLTDTQIRARLENYKRKYCTTCEKRYECERRFLKNGDCFRSSNTSKF
jgi:hypothetical protein